MLFQQKIADWLADDSKQTIVPLPFCYIFRGKFIPSGDSDGLLWKPSRGAVRVGKRLYRRSHYADYNGMKLRRQVADSTKNYQDRNIKILRFRKEVKFAQRENNVANSLHNF